MTIRTQLQTGKDKTLNGLIAIGYFKKILFNLYWVAYIWLNIGLSIFAWDQRARQPRDLVRTFLIYTELFKMMISAYIFTFLSGVVIIFQLCLAAGMPWGEASMGGKFPGKYPPKMKLVAIINILVLSFFTAIVLSRADIVLPQMRSFSEKAIWGVAFFSLTGTIMNTITPSRIERIWAPVALIQLITSILVALSWVFLIINRKISNKSIHHRIISSVLITQTLLIFIFTFFYKLNYVKH